ncbi:MAG TPA: NUDIX domain-containing protein [Candidatus Saccharimonadia bacterium]|jgi:8-oxo-dGTP pyrophosphatase MutT (NUDIX family)|nr:NUDIX domain-containing protein [Candidatus Saccharimonadia bacterium]
MKDMEKHYTSSVVILSDSKPVKTLLVHHRKYNNWIPPGGHQHETENPLETAVRETREETGIDISEAIGQPERLDATAALIPQPRYFLEEGPIPAFGDQPEHFHLDHVYVVRVPHQDPVHDENESHDIGWFTLEETEKLAMFDNVHLILRKEMAS